MKNSILISILGVLAVAALVTFSNSTAQDEPEARSRTQQKVMVLSSSDSWVMNGDSTKGKLPDFLKNGWRVVSITMGGEASAYVLLEK